MRSSLTLFVLLALAVVSQAQTNKEYYQLKHYKLMQGEQETMMDDYLAKALLPALHTLGIKDVGVFKQITPPTDTTTNLFVLIPFNTMDQFLNLEDQLAKDETYQKNGAGYINTSYDKPAYLRIESSLMLSFDDMPVHTLPKLTSERAKRVYELRSYESASEKIYKNKVDMFNAGGEVKLFDQLEFNSVFFAEVLSGANMPNLVYMTTFSDMDSRNAHWKSFVDSPEWKTMIALDKYKNNVSSADIYLLYPTDYSDY